MGHTLPVDADEKLVSYRLGRITATHHCAVYSTDRHKLNCRIKAYFPVNSRGGSFKTAPHPKCNEGTFYREIQQ